MSAIWDKFKKEEDGKKDDKSTKAEGAEVKKKEIGKSKKAKKAKSDLDKAKLFEKVIIKPIVSENAMSQQVLGKYVFEVNKNASKPEIAKAVKALYGVDVKKVNISVYDSQAKSFRNMAGRTREYKKAIVTVDKEQSIELFTEAK